MSIISWVLGYWQRHQDARKSQELHARLERNAAGRFSQKDYIKSLNKQVKARRESIRNAQEDRK